MYFAKHKSVRFGIHVEELFISPDGDQTWYKNYQRHRTNGPTVICADGTRYWHRNNKLHRTDGAAIIYPNGYKEWWENGRKIK